MAKGKSFLMLNLILGATIVVLYGAHAILRAPPFWRYHAIFLTLCCITTVVFAQNRSGFLGLTLAVSSLSLFCWALFSAPVRVVYLEESIILIVAAWMSVRHIFLRAPRDTNG